MQARAQEVLLAQREGLGSVRKASSDNHRRDGPKQDKCPSSDARNKVNTELVPCSYTHDKSHTRFVSRYNNFVHTDKICTQTHRLILLPLKF